MDQLCPFLTVTALHGSQVLPHMSPAMVKEAMDELCPESDSAEKHAVLQVLLPLFTAEQLPSIAPLLDEDLLRGLSGSQVRASHR